jgi:hypothetical protein
MVLAIGTSALCMTVLSIVGAEDEKPAADRWYRWSLRNEPSGYFHVVRKASGDEAAPVLLEHQFVIKWQAKRLKLAVQTFCRDDEFLSPVKIVSKGEGDDEARSFTATIVRGADGRGKLKADVGGREVEMDVPAKTITGFAMFEIVRKLPFDREKPFEFNVLDETELKLIPSQKIAYVGPDEVTVDGGKQALHKFTHTDGDRTVTEFWVDDKHELIRAVMDGRKEYLLTTEEKARAALKE